MAINLQTAGGVAVPATPAQLQQIRAGIGISPDSFLLNRANQTGLQTSTTISDFSSAVGTVIGTNLAVVANTAKVTNATHTGDVTGATVLTLATVNSDVGTFNSVTVNAKGLVTAATNIVPPASPVFTPVADGLAPLSGGGVVNFLRADGVWSAPSTGPGGTVTSIDIAGNNGVTSAGGPVTAGGVITLGLNNISPLGNVTLANSSRLTGDFTTAATRPAIQTDVLNGNTFLDIIPNGTGARAAILLEDSSIPTNAAFLFLGSSTNGLAHALFGSTRGSGVAKPLILGTGNSTVALTIAVNGNITAGFDFAATGAVTGSNLSGTNTGDQTLTGLLPVQTAAAGQFLTSDGTAASWATVSGSGTVTSVSVTGANGVTGSVATDTSTPAITLTLGAITPDSVAATGAVTGSNLSGTNTGDNSTNTQYANDYRVANFVAGTNYLAPNGSAAALTGFPTFDQDTTGTAAGLSDNLPVSRLNTGVDANASTFWRGDGTWVNPIADTAPPAVLTTSTVLTVAAHANRKHIPVSSGTAVNIDMPATATNGDKFVIINLDVGLVTLRTNTGGTLIGAGSLPATLAQYTVGEVWFTNGDFVRIS